MQRIVFGLLQFYGALTLKSAMIFASFLLKLNLSQWHYGCIVPNRHFMAEPEITVRWKFQPNLPQKKKSFTIRR